MNKAFLKTAHVGIDATEDDIMRDPIYYSRIAIYKNANVDRSIPCTIETLPESEYLFAMIRPENTENIGLYEHFLKAHSHA